MIRKQQRTYNMTRSAVILSKRAKQLTIKMDDEEKKNCFFLIYKLMKIKRIILLYLFLYTSFHSNFYSIATDKSSF